MTMVCLVFTAVVTPVEVAFLSTKVNGLFVVNRIVDAVFVVVSAVVFNIMLSGVYSLAGQALGTSVPRGVHASGGRPLPVQVVTVN